MSLFKKKCAHCGKKINRNEEVLRKVKDPIFVEKKEKPFCCDKHANEYEEASMNCRKAGGCCCGR